jgi:hypothetical protein
MKFTPILAGLGAMAAFTSAVAVPDNGVTDLMERSTSDLTERTIFGGGGWCFSLLGIKYAPL